jgi:hypothetical protein
MKTKRLRKNDISRAYDGPGIERPMLGPSIKTIVNGVTIIKPFKSKLFVDPIKRLRKVAANVLPLCEGGDF